MNDPELYQQYDRQQAISFFGRLEEAKALCEGQWLILPNAIVCLTTVGKPPRESHFHRASRFRWVAEQPYQAANDEWAFLPLQVRAGHKERLPMHLFVRPAASQGICCLGMVKLIGWIFGFSTCRSGKGAAAGGKSVLNCAASCCLVRGRQHLWTLLHLYLRSS